MCHCPFCTWKSLGKRGEELSECRGSLAGVKSVINLQAEPILAQKRAKSSDKMSHSLTGHSAPGKPQLPWTGAREAEEALSSTIHKSQRHEVLTNCTSLCSWTPWGSFHPTLSSACMIRGPRTSREVSLSDQDRGCTTELSSPPRLPAMRHHTAAGAGADPTGERLLPRQRSTLLHMSQEKVPLEK